MCNNIRHVQRTGHCPALERNALRDVPLSHEAPSSRTSARRRCPRSTATTAHARPNISSRCRLWSRLYVYPFLPSFLPPSLSHLSNPLHRLLTTPIELIKIQQQKHQQLFHTTHETLAGKHTSPTSASASARAIALHIYRTGGIRALYRGLSATIWRDVGGYGLYFYGVRASLFPIA